MTKSKTICESCGNITYHPRKRLCNTCYVRNWRKNNPEKTRIQNTNANRARGRLPMSENRKCSQFLGIHVAERVLRNVFKDVKTMPPNNPGYDFICNHGKKIDVKSACTRIICRNRSKHWIYHISTNKIADYFLCIAFDNRKDLNPLHLWLIDGNKINSCESISISKTTINKWDKFKLPLNSVISCCDSLKLKGVNDEK